jgi:choline dehydrogenase
VAINDLIVKDGRRSSIFRSYVLPKLAQRNLTVLTHTLVSKLIFRGTTVIGVEAIRGSSRKRFMADREVILSMGAINTPKVLMQSGIGPEPELRPHAFLSSSTWRAWDAIIRITCRWPWAMEAPKRRSTGTRTRA